MNDAHLLLVSLGPVQDFIAQARRSRDLWFGSHLLSELSRAAAAALAADGACLIFPALDNNDPELEPCDKPTRLGDEPPVSIANKILASLPAGLDPKVSARKVRERVRNEWRAIAQRVRVARANAVLEPGREAVWAEQVEDILEFYAVWVPLDDSYRDARKAAEAALAGRKNLRDFHPWTCAGAGLPKSSLDGARASVLRKNRDSAFRRLRIADGEQLDAIGLIKRAGFEPEQFVPIVNVAAAAWLRQAAESAGDELKTVRQACESKIPQVHRGLPVVEPLPFDASVLYPSRWPALFKEIDPPEKDAAVARAWGEANIYPLLARMRKLENGEPPAYVACLVADGDHMGKAIETLDSPERNRAFSQALAQFPREARHLVERSHLGSLIYAGGDDVLAFLPVATAPACAGALARAFRARLETAVPEDLLSKPTLSVGIAVGHTMEAMSVLLDLARQAERAAKNAGRNAVAIIVDKRSGGQRRVALSWNPDPSTGLEPLERLDQDAKLLDSSLSTGKVHELDALLRRFPDPERDQVPPDAAAALAAYAADLLAHTGEGPSASLADLGVVFGPAVTYAALRSALAAAIDRILVVRALREAGWR